MFSVSQIFELFYVYCENTNLSEKAEAMGTERRSLSRFMKKIDDLFKEYYLLDGDKIGGANSTVEMDETRLFTRKYDNGRVLVSRAIG
ncbi:hypothetical protein ENBRE01_3040 [Enteropsectra breve]|nr:hypothetical protein ENBRE01_3040 [Enteropsectra breve]